MADVESTYSVLKAGLAERIRARPAVQTAQTNVLTYIPVNRDDIRTEVGTYEVIAMAEANGVFDTVVFCGPGQMRFDETLMLTVLIEVHGRDSTDGTQANSDRRVNELLYEILAEISLQPWEIDEDSPLHVFDYLWVEPAAHRWSPGRLKGTSVFATACELDLQIRSRRSFTFT